MSLFTYTVFERRYMLVASLLCALSGAALFCSHELEDTAGLCLVLKDAGGDYSRFMGCVSGGAVIQFRSLYWLLFLQAACSVLLWNLLDSIHYNFSMDVGLPFTYKSSFSSFSLHNFSSRSDGSCLMSKVLKVEFANLFITSVNIFVMLKYLKINFVDLNTSTQNGLDKLCAADTHFISSVYEGHLQCFDYLSDGMMYKSIFNFALCIFIVFLVITLYNFLFSLVYLCVVCGGSPCKPPRELKNFVATEKMTLKPTDKLVWKRDGVMVIEGKWPRDEDEIRNNE